MAGPVAEEDKAHQPGTDQHRQADAGDGGDHHVQPKGLARRAEIEQGKARGDDRGQHHPAHQRPESPPFDGSALGARLASVRDGIVAGHGFHLALAHGIIKGRVGRDEPLDQ